MKILPFLLFSLLLCLGCSHSEGNPPPDILGYGARNGAKEAKKDIEEGHPALKAFGLPHPATPIYARLLKEKLNLTYQMIAGCVVDSHLTKYAEAYNTVVADYIVGKYGKSAMADIWKQAQREYEAKRAADSAGK